MPFTRQHGTQPPRENSQEGVRRRSQQYEWVIALAGGYRGMSIPDTLPSVRELYSEWKAERPKWRKLGATYWTPSGYCKATGGHPANSLYPHLPFLKALSHPATSAVHQTEAENFGSVPAHRRFFAFFFFFLWPQCSSLWSFPNNWDFSLSNLLIG